MLKGLAKNIPDVRKGKIETIKRQLDAGTYSVPAKAIAKSIINLHVEMNLH